MSKMFIVIIAISVFFGCLLIGAVVSVVKEIRETRKKERETGEKQESWWRRHRPSKRRLIQLYAALLFNANIKGFFTGNIYTGETKYMCVPGLNCYSCPGAAGACPLGALQNALAKSGTAAPYYVLGILVLFGLLLGRTICGFLCPVGLGQELLYKIGTPKLKKSRVTRILSYLKYVVLAVFVVAIPLIYGLMDSETGGPVPAFCKFICPAGTFGGALGLLINPANADLYAMLGPLFTWKFCVLVVICVASVFIFRCFCRFLCPLGAIYGFFNKFALIGVKLDRNKCTDCGLCVSRCKMDIRHVGDHECINCGECMDVCPAKAISWKGSKFFLHPNAAEGLAETPAEEKPLSPLLNASASVGTAEYRAEDGPVGAPAETSFEVPAERAEEVAAENGPQTRLSRKKWGANKRGRAFWLQFAAWTAALALLFGALIYYNFIHKEKPPVTVGNQVGDTAPDFSLDEYFADETFETSAQRGKILVLNFWTTYCTPCIQEIPSFEELANSYPDAVTVAIIHGAETEEDVAAFITATGWADYTAHFLQDDAEQNAFRSLGGRTTWPMTVILDSDGKIVFTRQGSVTYTTLELQIKLLLESE